MKRILFVILGSVSLAIGIVGAFLPVLPTTPFVLLAVFFYIRSSQRMYAWVMNSRFAGQHVHNVLKGHGIPLPVKIFSVAMSFCMIGYVSIFVTESFLARMLLGLLFLVQVYFMVRIKTLRREGGTKRVQGSHPNQPDDGLTGDTGGRAGFMVRGGGTGSSS